MVPSKLQEAIPGLLVYNLSAVVQSTPHNAIRSNAGGKSLDSGIIRVLIADDHPVVCLGLLGIINGQEDMTVVGQARSGTEAVALARKHSPDVILMDLRMPGMSGVEATAAIRAERPASAVIVLTTYQGDEDIRKALAAGAQSYLLKGMSHLKLLEAIRSVGSGHRYFPRNILNIVPEKLNRPALSPRELDILRLIVKGLSNQEISEALNITRGTVKWHVNIILRRLGVSDRTQAVVIAVQRGIVEI
jgi:two-component system NarL family response regulator